MNKPSQPIFPKGTQYVSEKNWGLVAITPEGRMFYFSSNSDWVDGENKYKRAFKWIEMKPITREEE